MGPEELLVAVRDQNLFASHDGTCGGHAGVARTKLGLHHLNGGVGTARMVDHGRELEKHRSGEWSVIKEVV
jgi:hypothetical protein